MIGNRVTVYLIEPDEVVRGELRKQNAEGVWVYSGWVEQVAVRFYPMRRVLEVKDEGPSRSERLGWQALLGL